MVKAVIFDMYETLITHYKCPLYFGTQMALDAGIQITKFQQRWNLTNDDRSTGKITFEEVIEQILRENNCYSQKVFDQIVNKRINTKIECFNHLHPQVIPMLQQLKDKEIQIGLISNCFSEEVGPIRDSILFPYFDAPYLSYEQKIQKPDVEIFKRCMNELQVSPEACIYLGDGGSYELETARSLGMKAIQATWYFDSIEQYPYMKKEDFEQIDQPLHVLNRV